MSPCRPLRDDEGRVTGFMCTRVGDGDSGESVEFDNVRIIRETKKAVLCVIDGTQHWIPQSQILDESEVWKEGDEGKLVITEWIATQKGLT